jgi:hypothetical protein
LGGAIALSVLVAGIAGCSREAQAPAASAPAAAEAAAQPASEAKAAPTPAEWKEVASPDAARDGSVPFRSDTVDIVVQPRGAPGDKLEYKIRMKAGDVLTYAWTADDAGEFWHEFHGHTADTVSFYKKALGPSHSGALVAPFDGIHGWYFENRGPQQVVVRLRMGGFYELDAD